MYVYIDIETLPDPRRGALEAATTRVKAPANYKNPLKVAQYIDAHGKEKWRKTALDGTYGRIACVCWAVGDGRVVDSLDSDDDEEESIVITEFWNWLEAEITDQTPTWVGHNVRFDLQFLWRRSVIHGIRVPFHLPWRSPPWTGHYVDTEYEWCGRDGHIKLVELCAALGIEADDDISGADVYDRWTDGDRDAVVKHCIADVERVREVHRRLR